MRRPRVYRSKRPFLPLLHGTRERLRQLCRPVRKDVCSEPSSRTPASRCPVLDSQDVAESCRSVQYFQSIVLIFSPGISKSCVDRISKNLKFRGAASEAHVTCSREILIWLRSLIRRPAWSDLVLRCDSRLSLRVDNCAVPRHALSLTVDRRIVEVPAEPGFGGYRRALERHVERRHPPSHFL